MHTNIQTVYTQIHKHTQTCKQVQNNTNTSTHTHTNRYTNTYTHIQKNIQTHTHTQMHTNIQTHINTHTQAQMHLRFAVEAFSLSGLVQLRADSEQNRVIFLVLEMLCHHENLDSNLEKKAYQLQTDSIREAFHDFLLVPSSSLHKGRALVYPITAWVWRATSSYFVHSTLVQHMVQ